MEDKSVILIGNGASLLNSGLGGKIDEFDEVIRINEGKTKGWEQDAGLKFTIWATFNPEKRVKKFIEGYKNLGYLENDIKDLLKEVKEIWYVGARPDCARQWKNNLVDEYCSKNIIKRHESHLMIKKINREIGYSTTGFALMKILTHIYSKIYIAGFDFGGLTDSSLESHHYFNPSPMYSDNLHDFKREYEATKDMINQGKIEYLTINSIIEKGKFIGEINPINCNSCGKTSNLYDWENMICHYCEERLWNGIKNH